MAFLTVMGLYNFDNSLLDSMVYPEGVDGEILKNDIILETAELEVIYPDPSFFKTAVGLWSHTRIVTWERIYNASVAKYDPIENYNRYEEETTGGSRIHSGTDTTATTENGTNATDGSISRTVSGTESGTANQNHSTTNQITAFDSNSLQTHDKSTANAEDTTSATRSGTETETNDTTITDSKTGSATITHGEQIADSGTRTAHLHGNIGVTTSQQMLDSELELAPKLNIYDYIVRDFKQRFCLLVY